MKSLLSYILLFSVSFAFSQNVEDYFVASANSYLQNHTQKALELVEQGLKEFPEDRKLQELKKKIEEQQDGEGDGGESDQGNDEQSKDNPEDTESPQQSGDPDGRNQGEQGTGSSDENPLDALGDEDSDNVEDQGKRFRNQRHENLLKALKNQEQDIQRRLLMGEAKSRVGRKQKDW